MTRARGLLLGGACLATLAGFTIAVSSAGVVPGAAVAHSGRVSSSAATTRAGDVTAIRQLSPAVTSGRATALAFVGAASAVGRPQQRLDANGPLIPSQEVDGVSPNAGMSGAGGEQEVIITGSGFTGATDVFFGTTDIPMANPYPCLSSPDGCFSQVSDTEIDADTPVETAGTVDVGVNAQGSNGPADDYSYFDPPTVTNVDSPQDQGATGVAVTGTNFSYPGVTPLTSGVSEVDLNPTAQGSTIKITNGTCATGTSPNCFTFADDSDLTINLPNSVPAGTYDVQVITPGGTSATSSADVLTVNAPAPTLSTVAPSAGTTAGGTSVNLTGTNFDTATDVFFGATDVMTFTINTDTSITVISPAHGAGQVNVTVENPGGTSGSQPYTFVAPPTLSTVAPSTGSTAGGTTVNLTGTNFNTATDVFFGADDVTSFTINSNTSITVSSPAHAAGGVSVTVENPGGTSGGQPYTYVTPPTLISLSPSSGSTLGGNNVDLTGTHFTGATDVNFGANDLTPCPGAPCFTFNSDTSITVDGVPANSAGPVNVDVVTLGGPSGNKTYTYVTPPTLTSLSPSSGSTLGGNNVDLTGTHFTGATDVIFGSNDLTPCPGAPCFTFNSDTSITVDGVPANAAGPVSVDVVTLGGPSENKTYTYVTPPTLTGLAPPNGSTVGGNSVVLTGTNFTGTTDVNFGATDISTVCGSGTCFSVDSDTQITVDNIPGGSAGPVNVNVVTPGGKSGNQTYTYLGPSLTTLNPTSGSTLGGNNVILTGTLFTGATDVNVGSHDLQPCPGAPCFTFNSDTQITATMPANADGPVSVNVVTPGGTTNNVTYTYVTPTPTLTSLLPTSGSTVGGNPVVLTGTGFTGATDVHVGSTDLTPCGSHACFTVNSDTQITVTMPSNTPGAVSVNVTTPGGTTGNLTYTYVAPVPTVTGVSPNEGAPAGGNIVTLTGTGFEAAGTPIVSQVTVGISAITVTPCAPFPTSPCFTVNSGTSITIGFLTAGTGQVNITVTNPSGTSSTSTGNTYTYNASLPTVTEVSPRYGATGGGEAISVLGSGFGQAGQDFVTDVFFNNTDVEDSNSYPCPSSSAGCFVVVGPTQLAVYTPAHGAGAVDVTVQTGLGVSNAGTADKYTFVAPGAYTALTPYRVCDTRPPGKGIAHNECNTGVGSNRTLGAKGSVTAQITSSTAGQVPSGAQAVVVNITAIDHSTTSTYVTAYPAGGSRPLATNISLSGGKVNGNLAIVQLSSGGAITLFNAVGSTDVIVDVEGYFSTSSGSAGEFHSIPPLRICDTRAKADTECAGVTSDPLLAGHWRDVVLSGLPPGAPAGTPSIPATTAAAAAVFNLTAVGGTEPTFLSVDPALANHTCPTSAPTFSNLNPAAGIALPNRAISLLGPNQDVCVFSAAGSVNLVIDLNGWFGSSTAPAGALFYSVPPTRVCDTRSGSGTTCAIPPPSPGLTPGETDPIQIAGQIVVPADDPHSTAPVAVVANLTGIAGTAPTFFTLYPSDAASRPRDSDLNPSAGQVISDLAIVGLSTTVGVNEGDVSLYNAAGDINAVLDVSGWFQ